MSTESEQALTALNAATIATTEQTAVAQALTDEVASKQAVIDSALNTSIEALQNAKTYDAVTGKNALSLTTTSIISALVAGDEVRFVVAETNDSTSVSIAVNGSAAITLANITAANQLFKGALVTARFNGVEFYVVEQINPLTGNCVADIGKLITDTVDVISIGEVVLNGATLSRETHAIAWDKIKNTSNLIDQATKDADLIVYGGYWGKGDGLTTFTLPIVGGEFIRMFDDGRGVDMNRSFGSWKNDGFKDHDHRVFANAPVIQSVEVAQQGGGVYVSAVGASLLVDNASSTSGINGGASEETKPRSIAYYGKTRL